MAPRRFPTWPPVILVLGLCGFLLVILLPRWLPVVAQVIATDLPQIAETTDYFLGEGFCPSFLSDLLAGLCLAGLGVLLSPLIIPWALSKIQHRELAIVYSVPQSSQLHFALQNTGNVSFQNVYWHIYVDQDLDALVTSRVPNLEGQNEVVKDRPCRHYTGFMEDPIYPDRAVKVLLLSLDVSEVQTKGSGIFPLLGYYLSTGLGLFPKTVKKDGAGGIFLDSLGHVQRL